ncbi:MAG: mechanosensitive ion channel [Bacteroidales bacterium]
MEFIEWLKSIWGRALFSMGGTTFTVQTLIVLSFSLFLLLYLSSKLKKLLIIRVFPRYGIGHGVGQSIAAIIRYVIVIIGLVIIVQASGIDLSALGILMGALGIGIGFGLQNITNNFISGIIILFERPIKIGDRVEVGDIAGDIVKISARATTLITNDNIAVVVPNSDFINSTVINWSLNDRNVRFNFPVGVAYKEDPAKIKKLLIEVAKANPGVHNHPAPDVLFDEYGDSSLNFILRVWTNEYSNKPKVLKSQLYYAIFEAFREHGVEIPFPQRDVYLKSGFTDPPVPEKSK